MHEENRRTALAPEVERIGREIVDASIKIHRSLGAGLLESVYEECLLVELSQRGLKSLRQVRVPISYEGRKIGTDLRLDLLVEDAVIIEVKSVETLLPVHEAQLLTYMKLSGHRLGYLLNFNVVLMRDGITRLIR